MWQHQIISDLEKLRRSPIASNLEWGNYFKEVANDIEALKSSPTFFIEEPYTVEDWKYVNDDSLIEQYRHWPYRSFIIMYRCLYGDDEGHRNREMKNAIIITAHEDGSARIHCCVKGKESPDWFPGIIISHMPVIGFASGASIAPADLISRLARERGKTELDTVKNVIDDSKCDLAMVRKVQLLLSCRNICIVKKYPLRTGGFAGKLKKRKDIYSYHVLRIKPGSGSSPTDQSAIITGAHNRIHFCRGHFKNYSVEAPLFGTHTGLYWWEPHLRGRDRSGFADKDYEIEAPKNPSVAIPK